MKKNILAIFVFFMTTVPAFAVTTYSVKGWQKCEQYVPTPDGHMPTHVFCYTNGEYDAVSCEGAYEKLKATQDCCSWLDGARTLNVGESGCTEVKGEL